MNLKKDILWLDLEDKLLMMNMESNCSLSLTGELKKVFIEHLGKESNLKIILASFSDTEQKTIISFLEINDLLENSKHSFFDKIMSARLLDGSELSLIELANNGEDSFKEYEVFAKNYDPTAISGPGGYDDDTASTVSTMYAF